MKNIYHVITAGISHLKAPFERQASDDPLMASVLPSLEAFGLIDTNDQMDGFIVPEGFGFFMQSNQA